MDDTSNIQKVETTNVNIFNNRTGVIILVIVGILVIGLLIDISFILFNRGSKTTEYIIDTNR